MKMRRLAVLIVCMLFVFSGCATRGIDVIDRSDSSNPSGESSAEPEQQESSDQGQNSGEAKSHEGNEKGEKEERSESGTDIDEFSKKGSANVDSSEESSEESSNRNESSEESSKPEESSEEPSKPDESSEEPSKPDESSEESSKPDESSEESSKPDESSEKPQEPDDADDHDDPDDSDDQDEPDDPDDPDVPDDPDDSDDPDRREAPAADDDTLLKNFLENELIPEYGVVEAYQSLTTLAMDTWDFDENGLYASLIQDFDEDGDKEMLVIRGEKLVDITGEDAEDSSGFITYNMTVVSKLNITLMLYEVEDEQIVMLSDLSKEFESLDLISNGITAYDAFMYAVDDGQYDQKVQIVYSQEDDDAYIEIFHSHGAKPATENSVVIEIDDDMLELSDDSISGGEILFAETVQKGGEGLEMLVESNLTESPKPGLYEYELERIDLKDEYIAFYEDQFRPMSDEEKEDFDYFHADKLTITSKTEETDAINEVLDLQLWEEFTDEEAFESVARGGGLSVEEYRSVYLTETFLSVDQYQMQSWYATDGAYQFDKLSTYDLKTGDLILLSNLAEEEDKDVKEWVMDALDEQYGTSLYWDTEVPDLGITWRKSAEDSLQYWIDNDMSFYVDSFGNIYATVYVEVMFGITTLPVYLGNISE